MVLLDHAKEFAEDAALPLAPLTVLGVEAEGCWTLMALIVDILSHQYGLSRHNMDRRDNSDAASRANGRYGDRELANRSRRVT